MSFLGVDIGSSQVKAVAFDSGGSALAAAYRKYPYATPRPGWMELDAAEVLRAALEAIGECAASVAGSSPVTAIGVSSQGEAFAALDGEGRILAPAMISGDSRAAAVMEAFSRRFGAERLYRITGHTPSPMFTLAKLLWLKEERPELMRRARRFLCFEDLLIHALTGEAAMGWPLAGRTMLFDVRKHAWSAEILSELELTPAHFAAPQPPGSIAGTVKPEAAGTLHLPEKTVMVTGGHDQVMAALGCGVTEPGSAMLAAGSVECLVPVLAEEVFSDELRRANLCTYDYALAGRRATLAYSLTGSNMQEYFQREFGGGADFRQLLDAMPEAPARLLVLPYLTPSGTPWFDTATPACVYGWRFDTSRGELLKGFWEGIAFEMRLNLELLNRNGIPVDRLIASGGGFRHPAVVQLHADILNLPISIGREREAGCRGAALLAARAVEPGFAFPPLPVAAEVAPRPEHAEAYREKFSRWKEFTRMIRTFAQDQPPA